MSKQLTLKVIMRSCLSSFFLLITPAMHLDSYIFAAEPTSRTAQSRSAQLRCEGQKESSLRTRKDEKP